MEDARIVDLYWARSERAIEETAAKYGNYCYAIAFNILANAEDADESVNDTYLRAWNSMPPHRPTTLATFLGKITRRVSIDKWRGKAAEKRGGGEIELILAELPPTVILHPAAAGRSSACRKQCCHDRIFRGCRPWPFPAFQQRQYGRCAAAAWRRP